MNNDDSGSEAGAAGREEARTRSGNPNALGSYLSEIGNFPPLGLMEQNQLWSDIDALAGRVCRAAGRFGFVATEYCRIIGECLQSNANAADYFLYSSLTGGQEGLPSDLNAKLAAWRARLEELHAALEKEFSADGGGEELRRRLTDELNLFRLNGLVAAGLVRTAENYAELATDERRELAESRFLMRSADITRELVELRSTLEELGVLQQKMAEANLRLVISIAQRYRDRGVSLDDIIQEGNHGLLLAIQRFDYRLGNKFSTYASWWIKHHILRAVAQQSRVIRIPLHMVQAIQSMNRTEQRMIQTSGREPEIEELAAALEMPLARVSALKKMAAQTISLQSPVGNDEDGATLEKLIADDNGGEPWRDYARKILYDRLHEMLNLLPERERQIIIYRFGLCGQQMLSLAEISRRVNLSRERVRQLEAKIMESLRSPDVMKFIDGTANLEDV